MASSKKYKYQVLEITVFSLYQECSLDSIEAVGYWLAETDPLREHGVVTDHGTERAVTVVLKRFYCMESYE